MSRARLISTVLVFLASVTGCKSGDTKEAAASSGPPCAKVLAAVDRTAAGELFPGSTPVNGLPKAAGRPFEMGNQPLRYIDIDDWGEGSARRTLGPDDGRPIYIVAAGFDDAAWVYARAPVQGELRLVVMRPFGVADSWRLMEEAAPVPKSLADWWPRLKNKANSIGFALEVIGPEIAEGFVRTAGRCRDAVSAATGEMAKGESGVGLAEVLRAELPKCQCKDMDEPGFSLVVSFLLVTSNPRLNYGWLPLDHNVFGILPKGATVDVLAARLASPEPIPEPPPLPRAHVRGTADRGD